MVEGVQFQVADGGALVRAVILADVLQHHFGANASDETWVPAYQRHQLSIDYLAVMLHRKDPDRNIVVISSRHDATLRGLAQPTAYI
jgi:hypothetical protein